MRRAMIRIKTEEEMGGRPENWNDDGGMDYLFGGTEEAYIDDKGDAFVGERWWVFAGQFEILDVPVPEAPLRPEVLIRVKTEEELGGRPGNWNDEGAMDYLLGQEALAIKEPFGNSFIYLVLNRNPRSTKMAWALLPDQVEVLEAFNG